jgi:hypothetical protein
MSKKSEKKNLLKNEKIGFLWKFFWLQFEIYMKLLIPITQRLYVDLCFGGWKTGGSNKYFRVRCNQYLVFVLFFFWFFEICEVGGLAIATRGFSQNWPDKIRLQRRKKMAQSKSPFYASSKCENSPKIESLPETNQGFGFLRLFFGFRASGWSRARPATRGSEGGRERARERREETSNREVSFLSSSDNFTEKNSANSLEPFD